MPKARFALLILVPFLIYALFFNVRLFQSNQKIAQSVQSLKDFEFERSISQAREAIALDPLNAEAYMNQAYVQGILWLFRKEKSYEQQMLQAFEKAFQMNPKSAVYRYKRAAVYADVGDFEKALQYIEEAIALDPYAGAYWNEKGLYLELSGQKAQAIEAYQKAFDLSKRQDIQDVLSNLKENAP